MSWCEANQIWDQGSAIYILLLYSEFLFLLKISPLHLFIFLWFFCDFHVTDNTRKKISGYKKENPNSVFLRCSV